MSVVKMALYLQLTDEPMAWEEVDDFTWENWDQALTQKGERRYTGNRVSVDPNKNITIHASRLSSKDMAIVMRFCGVRENEAPGSVPGGFIRRPEFVRFQQKRSTKTVLHEMNGENYTCRPK